MNSNSPKNETAAIISVAPSGDGAARPGDTRYTRPAIASSSPAQASGRNASPARSPALNIVTCTAPKSSSAPVPALSVR